MRLLTTLSLLLLAAAAGCGASSEAPAPAAPTVDLRITVWPLGEGRSTAKKYTLRCNPAGGTLPNGRRACERLLALRAAFAPVPRDTACTEIFGGPHQALVTGTFRGRTVKARFGRTDGCQISRWDKHRFLFPGALTGAS